MSSAPIPTRYVGLLRAVNVGGTSKLPMALLRQICVDAGCTEVTTYIQSGNVVLSSTLDEPALRTTLGTAIAAQSGASPDVMIRTAAEMADVVDALPYPDADPGHLHVAFLHEPPGPEIAAVIDDIDMLPEDAAVAGREVYLLLPDGIGRSKLPGEMGKRLGGRSITMRNWRTVTTLREMAFSPPPP